MIYTKYFQSIYEKYEIIFLKDSISSKWLLVQVEDDIIYSKKFRSKLAAQNYLDKLIGNIIKIKKK